MEIDSVIFAKYLIAKANERGGLGMNMTKLQKLLYISYGLYLAVSGTRLLNEHPQAWPYGPVFPTTRNRLLGNNLYNFRVSDEGFEELRNNEDINGLIDLVFRTFGDWKAGELSAWSHSEGSPWARAVGRDGFKWGDTISDADIRDYFRMLTDAS